MEDRVCELCGIVYKEGGYRLSYRPDKSAHPDFVYTRICKSAIDAQKIRDQEKKEGQQSLPDIKLEQCINKTGKYNSKFRWIPNPTEKI